MPDTAPPAGANVSTTSIQDVAGTQDTPSDLYAALDSVGRDPSPSPTPTPASDETPKPDETPVPSTPAKETETPADATQPAAQEEPADPLDQALTKATTPRRDYSGLTEKEKNAFKNMSNDTYNFIRPMFDQWKAAGFDPKKITELQEEAESLRKFRYVDHPRAYELSEDYEQAQKIVQNISIVHDHWKQQLIALRNNKPVSLLTRDARGLLVPMQPVQPTPEIEAEILHYLNKSATDHQLAAREVEQIQSVYKSNHEEYGRVLGDVHGKLFGKHEAALKPEAEKYLKSFPSWSRHKPEVKLAAYAIAALVTGSKGHISAKNKEAAESAVKAAVQASGPAASTLKTSSAKPGTTGYDEAEFKNFKAMFM